MRCQGVLDGVVEKRARDRVHVHPLLDEDERDGQRMGHVGLAGLAALILVRLRCVEVRPHDQVEVRVRGVVGDPLQKVVQSWLHNRVRVA